MLKTALQVSLIHYFKSSFLERRIVYAKQGLLFRIMPMKSGEENNKVNDVF